MRNYMYFIQLYPCEDHLHQNSSTVSKNKQDAAVADPANAGMQTAAPLTPEPAFER
jgi:hypothetical protein